MKFLKSFWFKLVLLFFFALALRLYRLGEVPVSLHWDEASWGYNAYSILKTGRDEYGQFFPLIFKAFGDYKAPLYVYSAVPSIAVFGLNEFAIRFPAALFGALNVVFLALFLNELFFQFKARRQVAFCSALWLALSPWHYHFSHGAWEANLLLAFFLLALLFFFRGLRHPRSRFLAAVCFYVYNSAKLLLPLTALGAAFFFGRRLLRVLGWPRFWKLAVFGLILVLPIFFFTFAGGAGGRLKVMSLFSYSRLPEQTASLSQVENLSPDHWRFRLFYGSVPYYFQQVFLRYLNYFSPRFLFFEGDWSNLRHGIPDFGVLNYLDIILLPLGAFFLIDKKIKNQNLIWYLLAVAPLPAALSRDVIHALRSYFLLLPLAVLSGFGLYTLWSLLSRLPRFFKFFAKGLFLAGYLFVFLLFWDRYFTHAPLVNSGSWQYGYREAVRFVAENQSHYRKVVFSSKYGQPYIFYLLHNQYPPAVYQKQAFLTESTTGDVGRVEKLDRIDFRELYWPGDRFEKNILYVASTWEIPLTDIDPSQARVLKEIYFLDGQLAFRIVETLP